MLYRFALYRSCFVLPSFSSFFVRSPFLVGCMFWGHSILPISIHCRTKPLKVKIGGNIAVVDYDKTSHTQLVVKMPKGQGTNVTLSLSVDHCSVCDSSFAVDFAKPTIEKISNPAGILPNSYTAAQQFCVPALFAVVCITCSLLHLCERWFQARRTVRPGSLSPALTLATCPLHSLSRWSKLRGAHALI